MKTLPSWGTHKHRYESDDMRAAQCAIAQSIETLIMDKQWAPCFARNAQHDVDCMAAVSQELLQLKVDAKLNQASTHLHSLQVIFPTAGPTSKYILTIMGPLQCNIRSGMHCCLHMTCMALLCLPSFRDCSCCSMSRVTASQQRGDSTVPNQTMLQSL